jgi:hypothetical protein
VCVKWKSTGYSLPVIPVLVTGIQQRRVCGAKGSSTRRTSRDWIPVTSTGMTVW